MFDGVVETDASVSKTDPCNGSSLVVEVIEAVLETLALLTDEILHGHFDVVEFNEGSARCMCAHHAHLFGGDALGTWDQEEGKTFGFAGLA